MFNISTPTLIHICTYNRSNIYTYIHIYTYTYTHTHIYIHIHTYTYTHTYTYLILGGGSSVVSNCRGLVEIPVIPNPSSSLSLLIIEDFM